jgi:hypothetical protein
MVAERFVEFNTTAGLRFLSVPLNNVQFPLDKPALGHVPKAAVLLLQTVLAGRRAAWNSINASGV